MVFSAPLAGCLPFRVVCPEQQRAEYDGPGGPDWLASVIMTVRGCMVLFTDLW